MRLSLGIGLRAIVTTVLKETRTPLILFILGLRTLMVIRLRREQKRYRPLNAEVAVDIKLLTFKPQVSLILHVLNCRSMVEMRF